MLPTCRGSVRLGTACGCCSRCIDELNAMRNAVMDDEDFEKMMRDIDVARKAIVDQAKGKTNYSGMIVCPACKDGRLSFAVAHNGHISAECDTEKCIGWKE